MKLDLSADRPIYTQLIEQITFAIVSGEYRAGEKLKSVRDLAAEAAVNPNTMQKALAELERQGLLYSQRTAGRYITEDAAMLAQVKEKIAMEQIDRFFMQMERLGLSRKETLALITKKEEASK